MPDARPERATGDRPGDLRVGTDVVHPSTVSDAIASFGERYLARLYTATERLESADDPVRLAARFAAKEAVVKVLRPRPDEPVDLHEIGIVHDDRGAPTVVLTGAAADLAARQGLRRIAVSIAHEHDIAVGTAVSRIETHPGVLTALNKLSSWTSRTMHRS